MRLRSFLAATFTLGAALALAGPAPAQPTAPVASQAPAALPGAQDMVAHRAAYRLSFDKARDNSDVARAEGAMLFEVLDACDGWASRQRLTMRLQDRDGQTLETASDYSTWESKDGRRLRFSLTQMTAGAVSNRVSGEAVLQPDGSGTATYENPRPSQETLPAGTLLPMAHTIRAIEAARANQRILNVPLMDGTSDDGAQDSTTILSQWGRDADAKARFPLLANQESGRMRIAFFGKDSNGGGASSPDYEVGLRYYANGVADELNMDFGEFSVNGRLETLEAIPGGC
ncbi:cell envelope integrity EipB family protein [Roseomonas sp. SSH11]|uniref:Cell envelope integrity EipB family protein n=1 Tax=Pararoseomonas baculiformis TaxID=2820812 RepID=A0ABS4A978_9PROT|nr:cell envelope integrity EipB family protein [Pararoseomonas baculiformis]MBP0443532.1 cell envelope integrity EipB family protein [Pararoseomonas baculiformis]